MIVIKASDKTQYLLTSGKLVTLSGVTKSTSSLPKVSVSDASFARLVTAFGPVVS